MGKWEVYATFRTPKQICEGGNKVFFLADNSLFSYGKNDKEIRELSRLNILSDNNIILIAKSDNDLLVVVYNNSNIDLIDMNTEKTHNLPYIKNASITASKTVNDISFFGNETYLATDFGIVVLNNDRKEIKQLTLSTKRYTRPPVKATISIAYVPTAIIPLSRRRNPLRHKQLGRDAKLLHKKIASFRRRFAYAA